VTEERDAFMKRTRDRRDFTQLMQRGLCSACCVSIRTFVQVKQVKCLPASWRRDWTAVTVRPTARKPSSQRAMPSSSPARNNTACKDVWRIVRRYMYMYVHVCECVCMLVALPHGSSDVSVCVCVCDTYIDTYIHTHALPAEIGRKTYCPQ
jgi:hypothetical protein